MGTQLKFIVQELNQLFPGKNYNLIMIDSLNPDQFLQVLSSVLAVIEARDDFDIRDEGRDVVVKRILSSLHILKYKPPNGDLEFAQALLLGDKTHVFTLLEWLLQQRELLEKRAYLAKYLVKIEIPNALRGDPHLEEIYENYEQMLEMFKEAHRERELVLANNVNTAELRGDLSVMEREREIVAAKVAAHHKSRVEGSKTAAALLSSVQSLRQAKSKRDLLVEQKARLEASLEDLERFVTRTKQQVAEARRAAQGVTPQGLLQRAEEEKRVSLYIAEEKLPADLEVAQGQLEVLRHVTQQTGLSRTDLAQVEKEVRSLSSEVTAMLDRRMAAAGPAEDKLAPFRQQVAMLARRKESAAEALAVFKKQESVLKSEFNELQDKLSETEGTMVNEEQFRAYVVQLRARTEVYKARKSQLSSQAAECGVLTRTIEVLKARQDAAMRVLAAEEARLGLSGFTVAAAQLEEVSATKSQLDTDKERSLEALSRTILELNQLISSKKAKLAPAIQELRPLREQYHQQLGDYTKVKQLFETTAANLGSATSKIEQEVRQLEEDTRQASSQITLTKAKYEVDQAHKQALALELTLYASNSPVDKAKSLREQLNAKLAEEERKSRHLKESQKQLREQEPHDERQLHLWQAIHRLFEVKLECLERSKREAGVMTRERGAETLVLPNN